MFTGVYTALVTPFKQNGEIDFKGLQTLLEKQIASGIDGLVLLGTTAESATMTASEKDQLLAAAVKQINKRVKIIIGAGTNSTVTTLQAAKAALAFDPDALLIVTPYYNKPNISGLIAHYTQVAQLGKPIVLYHIPGRTGLKLPLPLMSQLLEAVPQICAVKESDYDISFVTDMAVKFGGKLDYICGNDDLFPQFLALNSAGIISAAGNVLAPSFVEIYREFNKGNTQAAFKKFAQIYPLIKACYLETNPTCVKYILSRLGICGEAVRLPLGPVDNAHKAQIDALLQEAAPNLFI